MTHPHPNPPLEGEGIKPQQLTGRVLAAHGRHYVVRTATGTLTCFTRGKKSEVACGDHVVVEQTAIGQGVINSIVERNNLMYRSDTYRSKVLAANLARIVIVVATEPSFSEDLLGRALAAAETLGLPAHIVLNKTDLTPSLSHARQRLALYADMGYAVHEVSAIAEPEATNQTLLPVLAHGTSLFLGQSGMGKSSLLNLLIPDAQAATREISEALQTGKHTTTDSRLYDLPHAANADNAHASIIDTPGFQEFGLAHLTPGEIERGLREFASYLGQCRFYNCSHLAEPGCAIRTAVEQGTITARRYQLFVDLNRASRHRQTI